MIELAEHKLSGKCAGDAKAVAPGKGNIQHSEVVRVGSDDSVRGGDLHIGLGQGKGEVLEEEEKGDEEKKEG